MHRGILAIAAAFALAAAIPLVGSAKDGDKDKDKNLQAAAVQDATVHFGAHQPQVNDAVAGAAVTHFLNPEETTIHKRGSVTFVVNGGGHGIVIHPVSKDTTRDDIAADLCDGLNNETGDPVADRKARFAACGGNTVPTLVSINGTPVLVTGTANLDYSITDGKDNLIIQSGFNVTAANTSPATVVANPRLDDATHTAQIIATSGRSAGDTLNPAAIAGNQAGAFLTGSANPATAGNRIKVTFEKTGRYLVICMNRGHSLNDHMFGFINVVDDGEDKEQ